MYAQHNRGYGGRIYGGSRDQGSGNNREDKQTSRIGVDKDVDVEEVIVQMLNVTRDKR